MLPGALCELQLQPQQQQQMCCPQPGTNAKKPTRARATHVEQWGRWHEHKARYLTAGSGSIGGRSSMGCSNCNRVQVVAAVSPQGATAHPQPANACQMADKGKGYSPA